MSAGGGGATRLWRERLEEDLFMGASEGMGFDSNWIEVPNNVARYNLSVG